jgi:Uma2 family endonuclease
MFIYYDSTQVRTKSYRGPDFFFVNDVDGTRERPYWAVWLENGRYPNVIGELLSPTTAGADRTTKKQLYERVFHTAEYFLYDPAAKQLEAYRLGSGSRYQPITANDKRRFWLEELGLWIGTWVGPYLHLDGTWPRFYDAQGQLLLTGDEHQTAEQAELAALKARLAELEQK